MEISIMKRRKTESYPIYGMRSYVNAAQSDPIPSMREDIVESALFYLRRAGCFAKSMEMAALRILYGPPRKNPIAKMTIKYGIGSKGIKNLTTVIRIADTIS